VASQHERTRTQRRDGGCQSALVVEKLDRRTAMLVIGDEMQAATRNATVCLPLNLFRESNLWVGAAGLPNTQWSSG
jgi:hypothetical protein